MGNPGELSIECGTDWAATMTYKRAGQPVHVDQPFGQIRTGKTTESRLLLQMDSTAESPIITQAADGVLSFLIPAALTATLPPGQWWWSLFGVVEGRRKRLVPNAEVHVSGSTSEYPVP